MPRARKKPVEIEYELVADVVAWIGRDWSALPEWIRSAYESGVIFAPNANGFYIRTLEGDMHVSLDDVLIRGVTGELYACKLPIFEATYDMLGEASDAAV
jgi:hypothetical protein